MALKPNPVPARTLALLAVLLGWMAAAAAPAGAQQGVDKALGRPATASSIEMARIGGACPRPEVCAPGLATDGRADTRWSSEYTDQEWWQVDLGAPREVNSVAIDWEPAYARRYRISTSTDGVTFTTAAEQRLDLSQREWAALQVSRHYPKSTGFSARTARYVRISGLERASKYGLSIWTVGVFGPADRPPAAQPPPAPSAPTFESTTPPPATPTPATPSPTSGDSSPAGGVSPTTGPAPGAGNPPAPAAQPPGSPALRQLSTPAVVRMAGRFVGSATRIRLLTVRAPKGARIRVVCKGAGCPKRVRARNRTAQRLRQLERSFRTGTVIEIFVTQRGTYGHYTRFRFRRGAAPARVDRCMPDGASRPTRCPSA